LAELKNATNEGNELEKDAGQLPDASQNPHPLSQLYFYLTEGCNLACRHCWLAPKFQDEKRQYPVLSVALFKKIIEEAKPLGLSGVKLTGGEPFMHPDIGELLDYLSSQQISTTVETNGVLCTKELAQKLAQCKNTFVSVSLDGADAETHEWVRGVAGSFEKALQGARYLTEAGLKPQIIFSVMQINKNQLEAVVRVAESVGAGSVKFNLVQPTARGERMHEAHQALTIQEYLKIGEWVEKDLSPTTKLKLYYDYPMAFRPLNKLFGNNGDGCSRCGILGILGVLADGSYALCGIGTSIPEMIFGHAERDDLAAIWKDNRILNDLRRGLPGELTGICAQCLMKNLCMGSCIAQNYYRSKNLWAAFWVCDLANEYGLFPQTRKNNKTDQPIQVNP
jgi:SynChlorMet cassette radical SAM/SPASM protein ScmF